MSFDNFWHADAGNVLTLAGMVISLYFFHMTNVKRFTKMEFKVNLMWRRFAKRFNMDANLPEEGDDGNDDDNGFSHS